MSSGSAGVIGGRAAKVLVPAGAKWLLGVPRGNTGGRSDRSPGAPGCGA